MAAGAAPGGDALLRQRLEELPPRPWFASSSYQPASPPVVEFSEQGSPQKARLTLGGSGGGGASSAPSGELDRLVAAAQPSPFAREGKSVVDPSYRDARELLPDAFTCAAAAPPPAVLAEAAAALAPDATHVCAELLKLNIYGPGGQFKAHRDTPMGGQHVGSLVLRLPGSAHVGGGLALRQGGQERVWAPPADERIHWAAFPPDVEHEVLPVTDGRRLTFSYNLYSAAAPPAPTPGVPTPGSKRPRAARGLPLYSAVVGRDAAAAPALEGERDAPALVGALRSLLADPAWHPTGAKLGIILGHKRVYRYAAGLEGLTDAMFPAALKGRDRLVWAALAAAGLQGRAVPILKHEPEGHQSYAYNDAFDPDKPIAYEEWALQQTYVGKGFDAARKGLAGGEGDWGDFGVVYSDDTGSDEFAAYLGMRAAKEVGITWVTPYDEQAAFLQSDKVAATGNGSLWYINWLSGAALLVDVPAAGQGVRAAAGSAGGAAGSGA